DHGGKTLRIIGRHVIIDLPELGAFGVEAKVDTGAFRTVIHCISCREILHNGKKQLEAIFDFDGKGEKKFYFTNYFLKEFKSSFGEKEMRYCTRTLLRM